jgi:phosphoketolase
METAEINLRKNNSHNVITIEKQKYIYLLERALNIKHAEDGLPLVELIQQKLRFLKTKDILELKQELDLILSYLDLKEA